MFGWSEIFIILIVGLVVIGPKELPALMRRLGELTRAARRLSREFQQELMGMEQGTGLDDLREIGQNLHQLNYGKNFDPELEEMLQKAIDDDLQEIRDEAAEKKKQLSTTKSKPADKAKAKAKAKPKTKPNAKAKAKPKAKAKAKSVAKPTKKKQAAKTKTAPKKKAPSKKKEKSA